MYASASDMQRYFGENELAQRAAPEDNSVTGDVMGTTITKGSGSPASMTALDKINESLEDASTHIDSYLASRYVTPVTDSDGTEVLRRPCADLARCGLFTHGVPEDLTARCDKINAWLRDIAKGVVSLPFTDEENEAGSITTRSLLRVS